VVVVVVVVVGTRFHMRHIADQFDDAFAQQVASGAVHGTGLRQVSVVVEEEARVFEDALGGVDDLRVGGAMLGERSCEKLIVGSHDGEISRKRARTMRHLTFVVVVALFPSAMASSCVVWKSDYEALQADQKRTLGELKDTKESLANAQKRGDDEAAQLKQL